MRDRRVFFIDDPKWFEKYQAQCKLCISIRSALLICNLVTIETQSANAWTNVGPDMVLSEAQDRIRTVGWDETRPAIMVTVR